MKTKKHQQGQVALLVLLVLTVALTIGLSVVSRTISEIRIAGDTEKSAQAYAAAEAGIEQALTANQTGPTSGTFNLGGELKSEYTVVDVTGSGTSTGSYGFPNPVQKDEAVQIWLLNYEKFINGTLSDFFAEGASGGTHQISIYWGTSSKISTSPNTVPALEVTLVYADANLSTNTLSNFGIEKYAFDALSTIRNNNFLMPNNTIPTNVLLENLSNQSRSFHYRADVNLKIYSPNKRYLLIRLKPLYSTIAHDIALDPNPVTGNNYPLPQQYRIIESQGESGNVVRRLRVYQCYPTLPGIFDFVLFNASNNPLSK